MRTSCRLVLRKAFQRLLRDQRSRRLFAVFALAAFLSLAAGVAAFIYGPELSFLSKWNEPPVKLLVAVASRPREADARLAIRETWAKDKGPDDKVLFFVGLPNHSDGPEMAATLAAERLAHDDIVHFDQLLDTYENLTLKTLSIFDWVRKNVAADYILKMDTDCYVKLRPLRSLLAPMRRDKLYMGSLLPYGRYAPYRHGAEKWVISYADYPHIRWPPYCFGSGYIVSGDLADPIAQCLPHDFACTSNKSYRKCNVSSSCPFAPIKFEDVTVGGILLPFLSGLDNIDLSCRKKGCVDEVIKRYTRYYVDNSRFINEPWQRDGKHKCGDDFLLFHRVNPRMMRVYYEGNLGRRRFPMCAMSPRLHLNNSKGNTSSAANPLNIKPKEHR